MRPEDSMQPVARRPQLPRMLLVVGLSVLPLPDKADPLDCSDHRLPSVSRAVNTSVATLHGVWMPVTLFLTRNPLKEFVFRGKHSGRFGELIVVETAKVASAKIIPGGVMPMPALRSMSGDALQPISTAPAFGSRPATSQTPLVSRPPRPSSVTSQIPIPARPFATSKTPTSTFATVMHSRGQSPFADDTTERQFVKVEHGVLEITFARTPGEAIGPTPLLTRVKHFTTMERFKADNGNGFYVQLRPKAKPYWITFEPHNSVVKGLRADHDGRCFRVHGGREGPEQGILIHEAPHVGWVIGCIGPRPLKNFDLEFTNVTGNESFKSMQELIQFVGRDRADLFVLDW